MIIVSFPVSLLAGAQVQRREGVIVAVRFITKLNYFSKPKVLLQAPYPSTSPIVYDNAGQEGGGMQHVREIRET